MSNNKPSKLFKVASEFNVSTQSIVDALSEKGYSVTNKPNTTITGEMLDVLEVIYGIDKVKNREHDRAREEYETRRSQILSQRNETVTADQGLEPLLEPLLAPQDGGLEPFDAESLDIEPSVPSIEPVELTDLDEIKERAEAPSVKTAKTSESDQSEDAHLPSGKGAAQDAVKSDAQAAAQGKSHGEDLETESVPESVESSEIVASMDIDVQQRPDVSVDQIELDQEEVGTLRVRTDKLKGTKVLGRVTIAEQLSVAGPGMRKRRKDRIGGTTSESLKSVEKTSGETAESKAKGKKKGKKSKVQSEDVDRKMRETMLRMQQTGTVGSKRQKRRKQRREERLEEAELTQLEREMQEGTVEVSEFVTVSDLAELLDVSPNEIIMTCMSLGNMVSINQRLDAAIIELVASEFGRDVRFIDAEELVDADIEEVEDAPEDLKTRSPIITVMGHVDHGKTSLLDYIRKAKVAAGEAGGITQHVGAYEVKTDDGRLITFLDTPGHEAFTAMRSRGAQATDIVILVVAADDSVMPQTIEAINHAKAAGVPIVVAINKIDKEGSNPEKIKKQLSEHDVIVEEWGGKNQSAEVSAKTGKGIDELLEKVLIEADLMELKANPDRKASGIVLEARIDKGKGIVANILVQYGTLRVGDPFVAGPTSGRVRAMENEFGKRIEAAGPSVPLQLTGFDEIPQAGDRLMVMKDEKTAKEIATQRQQIKREQSLRKLKHLTLDDLSRRMALGEVSELNIILKADVDGSIEALSGSLQKLGTDEVSVNIIHTGSGAITESDVLLASASDAIIIGFQVRPTTSARKLAEAESIDIRLFSVIYDAIDQVRDALEGLLSPEIKEEQRGTAEVREVFRISKVGSIAGCYIIDGKIERSNPVRIIRDGVVIFDGKIDSLKRFKDDVKEVLTGYECGIGVQNYNDLKVGDHIESYVITEKKRTLEASRAGA